MDNHDEVREFLFDESFALKAEPGFTLAIYTAQPGSPSEEALNLLTSWQASQGRPGERAPGLHHTDGRRD